MSTRFVEKSIRETFSDTRGNVAIRTWEGPAEDLDDFLQDDLPAGYVELDQERADDAWYRVTATYGLNFNSESGLVSRTWERTVNYSEKSIVLSPNAIAIGTPPSGKTAEVQAAYREWPLRIVRAAERYKRALELWFDDQTGEVDEPDPADYLTKVPYPETTPPSNSVTLAAQLFALVRKLDDPVWEVADPVLRKVEVVTSASTLVASSTNVGRFYTSAALAASETTLPAVGLIGWAGLSAYKWQKRQPEVHASAGGLVQLVQEYWGAAEYEEFMYGAPITT